MTPITRQLKLPLDWPNQSAQFPTDDAEPSLVPLYRLHAPTMPVVFSRSAMLAQGQQNAVCFCNKPQCPNCKRNLSEQLAAQHIPDAWMHQNAIAHCMQDPSLALAMRQLRSVYTEAEKQGSCAPSQWSNFHSDLDKHLNGILRIVLRGALGVIVLVWVCSWFR